MYFKTYPYPVIKNGKQISGQVVTAVRYLEFDIEYDQTEFQKKLQEQQALRVCTIQGISLLVAEVETLFQIGIQCLDITPYFFLKRPPKFVPGKIPTDGITGPL